MAEASPSGSASGSWLPPRRASARLVAAAESALPPLLRAIGGDLLRHVVKFVDDADLPCLRLTCKAFRDHSSKPEKKCRVDFLRTRALVTFAWASMPGFVGDLPSMLELAASVGCVGVLAELVDNRQCALTARACAIAAGKGRLDALAWLHSRGCPWDIDTCHAAAHCGHLEVLQYAHEHGCPWDESTCRAAAMEGHLEVLRYAHEHGCPWDESLCRAAAMKGHLEVLRYAHEHGCPWDERTCHLAALKGHVGVLRYAHEHGCPWDVLIYAVAAAGGRLEVLRYAYEHGCPLPLHVLEHCRAEALARGHAEVAEYLRTAQPTA
jgi:hypothetical protein